MATYLELAQINDSSSDWNDFRAKVAVAVAVKATLIIDQATPTAEALAWAKGAITGPTQAVSDVLWYVIASNDNLAISAILSATDNAIQSNVNSAIDAIYGAGA